MKVILLERVERLGGLGDVVNVKDGFARNFLLPRSKALRATDANMKVFEERRSEIESRNERARETASKSGGKLDGATYVMIRQAGDGGQLYGSVSGRDVAEAVNAGGGKVDRSMVILDRPIKTLGLHNVRVRLHPEVTVTVTVNVARSQDEAERQARGEDVIAARFEEERTLSAEAAAALMEAPPPAPSPEEESPEPAQPTV
ncbi:MAG TPA: 50S ribosomal protein L9 [Caulobacteraceae bacterium]|nr:50S ribosomal protein L9 [Caulobacteraceae bacterium]